MGAVTGQPTFFSLNKLEAILPCTGLKCTPLGRAKAPDEKKGKEIHGPYPAVIGVNFPMFHVCVCVYTEKKLTISIPLGMCPMYTYYMRVCLFFFFISPQSPVAATSREKVTKAWQPSDRMNSIKTGVCREPLLLYRRWQSHPKKYRNSHII
jgi:hypothetical protein